MIILTDCCHYKRYFKIKTGAIGTVQQQNIWGIHETVEIINANIAGYSARLK